MAGEKSEGEKKDSYWNIVGYSRQRRYIWSFKSFWLPSFRSAYISYTGGDDSQQDDSVPEAGEGTVLILYSLMCVREDWSNMKCSLSRCITHDSSFNRVT